SVASSTCSFRSLPRLACVCESLEDTFECMVRSPNGGRYPCHLTPVVSCQLFRRLVSNIMLRFRPRMHAQSADLQLNCVRHFAIRRPPIRFHLRRDDAHGVMAFVAELSILLWFASRTLDECEDFFQSTSDDFNVAEKEHENASRDLVF